MMVKQALQPMEQEIVQALRKQGALTTTQLTHALRRGGRDCGAASVRIRVNTLARFGLLVRQSAGKGGPAMDDQTIWVLAGEVKP